MSSGMVMRTIVALGILGLLLQAVPAGAQAPDGSVPLLVSTQWLADHLEDRDLAIRWTDQGAHDEALIPGARAVPHEAVMTMQGGHGLAPTDALVETLRAAGISRDSHVVVYGEPLAAGWLFFVLDYLGHPRLSMLDGGITKWRAENRPIARTPTVPVRGTFTPAQRPQRRATADDVQSRIRQGGAVLDARSPREYEAGHIPGAKLLPWMEMFADPRQQVFKSRDELVRLFGTAGAPPGSAVVTYCQIGLRSSALYFAARYAGFDVSNYVGSWSDWTARGLPVDRAASR
jgi:thiosulfate/3-mercaptopyruvate sulfurtransferase